MSMGRTKKKQKTLFDFERSDVSTEEQPYSIPKNWVWTTIKTICKIYTGNSINEKVKSQKYVGQKEGLLFIATKDVDFDGNINYETNVRINDYKNYKTAPANTALLCIEGGSAGRKVGFTEERVCFGNKLCAFNTDSINSKMVFHFLRSQCFYDQFNEKKHGLIGGVSISKLAEIFIPLPPLAEQKRIVSRIESLFSRLDEARAKAREVIDGFELWKSAILHKAFTGRLVEQRPEEGTGEELFREIQKEKQRLVKEGKIKKEKALPEIKEDEIPFEIPKGWKWVRLGEIISLQSGQDMEPSAYNSDKKGIPYITGASNIDDVGNITINRWIEKPKSIANKGDLLLTCKGTVGKIAFLQEEHAHIARQIMAISPMTTNPLYLKYFIVRQIDSLRVLAKSMIPGIERKNVLLFLSPLPPLKEQARIVSRIESLFSRMQEAVNKAKTVVEQIDAIKKSILEKAFRGELGTNDTTEESALALLKSAE